MEEGRLFLSTAGSQSLMVEATPAQKNTPAPKPLNQRRQYSRRAGEFVVALFQQFLACPAEPERPHPCGLWPPLAAVHSHSEFGIYTGAMRSSETQVFN